MVFIHRNRSDIANSFKEKCLFEHAEGVSDVQSATSDKMTLTEVINLWREKLEVTTHSSAVPFIGNENLLNPEEHEIEFSNLPGVDSDEEMDETANTPQLPVYRDFIFNSPEYEWLLGTLQRKLLPGQAEPNFMEIIRQDIVKSFPSSHKVSKNNPAEAFRMQLILHWDPMAFVHSQGYKEEPDKAIARAITLTGSSTDAQALTCEQYLHQTWPFTGKRLISMIKDVVRDIPGNMHQCTLPDRTELFAWIYASIFIVEVSGTADSIAEIGQQLAWLVKNFRIKSRLSYWDPVPMLDRPYISGFICDIYFSVERWEPNLVSSNGQCWHHMFRNPVIVIGYPIPRRRDQDTGLEIPLNMMAGLAQTQTVQSFNEKILIKGFSTLLVPTKRAGDALIWHLIYNRNGNRISYLDNFVPHIEKLSVSELETVRHILGWCSESEYYAGAVDACYSIKSSRLSKPHRGCALEEVRIHRGQMIEGGSEFSIGNKDTPLHISRKGLIPKLKWIHEKFVVLWDEQDKRGWLVNGTSALLHLLRRSLENDRIDDFRSKFCLKKEDMQEANEPHKASSAIPVLLDDNNLKQKLYEGKQNDYRIEDRIEELYHIVEKIIDHQVDVAGRDASLKLRARKYLEGWDFNDLTITSRDPIYPRAATLQRPGKSWVDFTRAIHAVTLFGRGFGEIIQPASTNTCTRWAKLPKDGYYLAASVDDLRKVMDVIGGEEENPMRLTEDIIWHTPHAIFGKCKCRGEIRARKHSDFAQVLLPTRFRDILPKNDSASLSDGGAVVFGQNRKFPWFWKDTGDPEEDEFLSSSEEPDDPVYTHDSGIGSSGIGSSRTESSGIGPGMSLNHTDYGVGIVCALPKELLAIRALFDERHEGLVHPPGDINHYALGCIQRHNVVAACLPAGEYGTCAAADTLSNMKRSFPELKICFLVGIGGGVPSEKNDIRLGDVVVSRPTHQYPGVIQYDLGKNLADSTDGLIPRGSLQRPPRFIMTVISDLESDPDISPQPLQQHIEAITARHPEYRYPGREHDPRFTSECSHDQAQEACMQCDSSTNRCSRQPRDHPMIHYGLIASGNQVMQNTQFRDQLAAKYNVLCFEMEAAGVMNMGDCLVVRGICDYADSQKNDIWQEYASATAAAYVKALLYRVRISSSLGATAAGSEKTCSRKRAAPSEPASPVQPKVKRLKGR
ncbi:hypothetical protein Dda_4874 [Drechslerella dactyloides]|uniref:Nucleoside phosphorylase domain-containing protein n=1 Tax=Drechslerella dactyloides TaxID=74499 RepID=A0AAD6NJM8_DREDA|nr:hypothetical protein Dda_4874 [Drechslerella dactyloides]